MSISWRGVGVVLLAGCSHGEPSAALAPPATPAAPVAPTTQVPTAPAASGAALVTFEAFGPAPGTTDEQLEAWSALVTERYLGAPDEARRAELDRLLAAVHPVDAAPAFLNAVRGLDMADPDDVRRAAELTASWYEAQSRVTQLVLDDPHSVEPVHVRNRLTQLDGWARWWTRKAAAPGSLASYRARVDELRAFLEEDRKRRRAQG